MNPTLEYRLGANRSLQVSRVSIRKIFGLPTSRMAGGDLQEGTQVLCFQPLVGGGLSSISRSTDTVAT